jgi:biopolymer transport protein ExbB
MDSLAATWAQADGVGRAVALVLLAMSVTAWVLILWKTWLLRRASADIARAVPAFWDAPDLDAGRARLAALDREGLLAPLLAALLAAPSRQTLQAAGDLRSQITRRLRDALHRGLAHLQWGQVVLASIGSTAPFVGLLGTVWGIYGALVGMAEEGGVRIERVAGPIGEALVMTAAGIAVAVPALLAYNAFGKWVAACEAELEGFAHDLRELALAGEASRASPGSHLDAQGAAAPDRAAGITGRAP